MVLPLLIRLDYLVVVARVLHHCRYTNGVVPRKKMTTHQRSSLGVHPSHMAEHGYRL